MYRKMLALLLIGWLLLPSIVVGEDSPTAEPLETEAPIEEPQATPRPANGYVLVTTATQAGWLPLPDEGEYSYTLKQVLLDGTEAENVIHLTPEGVYMEDSTCANHDCVDQGIVTLENKSDRILGNMIICLPNQVSLELYTPDEILQMYQGQ